MTREQLEKMFDERFKLRTLTICLKCNSNWYNIPWYIECWNCGSNNTYKIMEWDFNNDIIKQFIFDTIIPEVLKSTLTETEVYNINWKRFIWYSEFKQKAKELYNILTK